MSSYKNKYYPIDFPLPDYIGNLNEFESKENKVVFYVNTTKMVPGYIMYNPFAESKELNVYLSTEVPQIKSVQILVSVFTVFFYDNNMPYRIDYEDIAKRISNSLVEYCELHKERKKVKLEEKTVALKEEMNKIKNEMNKIKNELKNTKEYEIPIQRISGFEPN